MRVKKYLCSMILPAILLATLAVAGCGGDDSGGTAATGTARMSFSSTNAVHAVSLNPLQKLWRLMGPGTAHALTGLTDAEGNPVELTNFQISIREVRLKQEAAILGEDSVDFDGPFVVNLLDAGASPVAQTIGDAEVPVGNYDGIRFVLHKDAATDPPLTDRSVFIQGTVDRGAGPEPFTMWHDTGENFDFFGPNPIVVDENGINNLMVDFKLVSIIESIDFNDAGGKLTDINPDSADNNNKTLADNLKDAIKAAADFGEDSDDDGNLSESEDVD